MKKYNLNKQQNSNNKNDDILAVLLILLIISYYYWMYVLFIDSWFECHDELATNKRSME